MKKIIVAIIFSALTLCSLNIYAGDWHQIPLNVKSTIEGIYFINSDYGYGVTKKGAIIKFAMEDQSWKMGAAQFQFDLNGIYFLPNGKDGFAYGEEGMIMTTNDSGETWLSKMVANGVMFKDLVFVDSVNGFAIGSLSRPKRGSNGVVYRTTDGGQNWDSLRIDLWTPDKITASPDGTIYMIGKRNLYISNDLGKSWQEVNHPRLKKPNSVAFMGKIGIMVGMDGFVSKSSDGGNNWVALNNLPPGIHLFDVIMLDPLQYYVVGSAGELFYTNDGGKNWIPEASGSFSQLLEIRRTGNSLFACGHDGTVVFKKLDDE